MLARIRLLGRPELTDGLRNRRQLVIRGVTPLVLLASLVALAAVSGGVDNQADDSYRIAVEGTLSDPAVTDRLAVVAGGRLDLESVDDAALAVADAYDAGLVVARDSGGTTTVTVVSDAGSTRSRAAATLVRAGLYENAPYLDGALSVDIGDVGRADRAVDPAQQRRSIGRALAGLLLVQASVLVGTAAARIHGRRTTGALLPQLLLPLRRTDVVLGQGYAEMGLGVVTGVPILALLGLVATGSLLANEAARAVIPALAVILFAFVAVAAPLVALGLAVGIRARSSQQVAAMTAGSFVLVAVLARPVAISPTEPAAAFAALPLVGPAMLVRQTVGGAFDPVVAVLALVGTVVATGLLVRLAARYLTREHVALRSS